jgi:hypothetical protein
MYLTLKYHTVKNIDIESRKKSPNAPCFVIITDWHRLLKLTFHSSYGPNMAGRRVDQGDVPPLEMHGVVQPRWIPPYSYRPFPPSLLLSFLSHKASQKHPTTVALSGQHVSNHGTTSYSA